MSDAEIRLEDGILMFCAINIIIITPKPDIYVDAILLTENPEKTYLFISQPLLLPVPALLLPQVATTTILQTSFLHPMPKLPRLYTLVSQPKFFKNT